MRANDVLKTGNQMKAARALSGLSQAEVARRTGVHLNTVSGMERRGARLLVSGFDTVHRIMQVFQAAGVAFIDDAADHGVGVMLSAPTHGAAKPARAVKPVKSTKATPPKKTRQRRP